MSSQGCGVESLFKELGLGHLNNKSKLDFYANLKAALVADNKPTKVLEGDLAGSFAYPIHSIQHLIEDQKHVISVLVSSWALAVLQPMLDELNDDINISNSEKLILEIAEEDDNPRTIAFFENIDAFAKQVKDTAAPRVANIAKEWSNTLQLIYNSQELLSYFSVPNQPIRQIV